MPQKRTPKSRKITALASLAGLVLILAVLELTNTTHFLHKKATPISASSYTKGESAIDAQSKQDSNKSSSNSTGQSDDSQPGDQKSNSGSSDVTQNLLTPSGDFASNHHRKLSDAMASVCTTTPGATCTITFTKNGETRSLPSQVTDRGGSTYWNWTPQDNGVNLSVGTWQVKAVASLNGKTLSAADATPLEVTQ